MADRYFLDTNIFVSAVMWRGNEHKLLESAKDGKICVLASEYVLDELGRTLGRLGLDGQKILKNIAIIRSISSGIVDASKSEIAPCFHDVTDKKDAPILAACIKSGAVLVTGDLRFAKEAAKLIKVMRTSEVLEALNKTRDRRQFSSPA